MRLDKPFHFMSFSFIKFNVDNFFFFFRCEFSWVGNQPTNKHEKDFKLELGKVNVLYFRLVNVNKPAAVQMCASQEAILAPRFGPPWMLGP